MKIGISLFFTDYSIDVAIFAKEVERLGFDSLWVPEHPIMPVDATLPSSMPDGKIPKVYADMVDPFVTLGRASAVTTTLKLGTGICLVPERNPLLLAKEIATLDMYTKGRFIFGIGAGGIKEETEIMGGDFNRRWDQTREAIFAMKELWNTVESEFHGEFYDFPAVYSFPRPTQRPHPPIYLGSLAKRVFERIVEYGDGWIPTRVRPDTIKNGRNTLDKMCDSTLAVYREVLASEQPVESKR